jgi:lysozyme
VKTSPIGRALIEEFEGLFLKSYDDANDHVVQPGQHVHGTLTIGYGHTDAAGPPHVYIGMEITKDEADTILAADLASVEAQVNHLVKVPINQNQFDALVSFDFNTGGLGRSSTLRDINAGHVEAAADALLMWDRAGGRVLPGLLRRRRAERALFLKPETPATT